MFSGSSYTCDPAPLISVEISHLKLGRNLSQVCGEGLTAAACAKSSLRASPSALGVYFEGAAMNQDLDEIPQWLSCVHRLIRSVLQYLLQTGFSGWFITILPLVL